MLGLTMKSLKFLRKSLFQNYTVTRGGWDGVRWGEVDIKKDEKWGECENELFTFYHIYI